MVCLYKWNGFALFVQEFMGKNFVGLHEVTRLLGCIVSRIFDFGVFKGMFRSTEEAMKRNIV